jgi:hypothetical protein
VEIPIYTLDGTQVFARDGGYGLFYNKVFDFGDEIPFDIVEWISTPVRIDACASLQCRIYPAEIQFNQNLKIVCSNLDIATNEKLRIAFDIWNLEVPSTPINDQYSVHAYVYSFDSGRQAKQNWELVENAFYVIDEDPNPPIIPAIPGNNGDFNVGDAFQTSCNSNAPIF